MAVEWVPLGLVLAKLFLRALAQKDGPDLNAIADQLGDVGSAAGVLGRWLRDRKAASPESALGKTIAEALEANLVGILGERARSGGTDPEVAAAATIAANVMAGLVRSDRRQTADQALIKALVYPEELVGYVRAHGGAVARRDFVAEAAEPVFDAVLEAACRVLAGLAPTATHTVPAALTELLRRTDQITATLNDTHDYARRSAEGLEVLLSSFNAGPARVIAGARPRLEPGFVARDEMEDLQRALAGGGTATVCALKGMRGVGKSQLASAFAQQCEASGWRFVAWVTAPSKDQSITELAEIARHARVSTDEDPAQAARALVSWLSRPDQATGCWCSTTLRTPTT